MLIQAFFWMIVTPIGYLTAFLPVSEEVPIKLPYGVDEFFTTGVAGYKMLSTYFPPFAVVLQAFLIYLGFKLAIMIIKAIPIIGRTVSK